ncbi:carboxymuconolactone decarboxylase family protein [Solilutibacter silvestris]|uniref:Carboxymuconolactone decarboxylase-type protein n=1 Tax=Solilutibacter silvestris TaxID=1645665 RepID=A0A2K1Q256_9GAMM|nr:carboxymuconolactone decarboxylase family protein [Lysobacter silvestris]PNS09071.1 Carboxymuconolactone decarboxylase-type protein [Lysobacter silvestris]
MTRMQDMEKVAPALARQTRERLQGSVWKRPQLGPRDRSLVTVAALIARGQTEMLGDEVESALDNGVTPAELSETITHLAYYSGWGNAVAAIVPVAAVFTRRNIGADQLPPATPVPLPLDAEIEARRAKNVAAQFAEVAPGLVDYTADYLFRDLWLRPNLAPRDRSLATVAALLASGQAAQLTFHFGRAMDNGLTAEQAAEVVTHLAFYAGWPNAMSALPVLKEVLAQRSP